MKHGDKVQYSWAELRSSDTWRHRDVITLLTWCGRNALIWGKRWYCLEITIQVRVETTFLTKSKALLAHNGYKANETGLLISHVSRWRLNIDAEKIIAFSYAMILEQFGVIYNICMANHMKYILKVHRVYSWAEATTACCDQRQYYL